MQTDGGVLFSDFCKEDNHSLNMQCFPVEVELQSGTGAVNNCGTYCFLPSCSPT